MPAQQSAFAEAMRRHGTYDLIAALDTMGIAKEIINALMTGSPVARKDALRVFGVLEEETKTHWCLNEIDVPLKPEEASHEQ